MKQIAKVLLRDASGTYLMLEHTNHPTFPNDPDFPGGTVEEDETPLEGAVRETMEEIGVEIAPEQLELLYRGTNYSHHGSEYSLYLCRCEERPEIALSWEHTAFGWETPNDVIEASRKAVDTYMHMVADMIERIETTKDLPLQ